MDRAIPTTPVLADAGYGTDTQFRDGLTELGLLYVVGIMSSVGVWKPGQAPLPKRKWRGHPHHTSATKFATYAALSERPGFLAARTSLEAGKLAAGNKNAAWFTLCCLALPAPLTAITGEANCMQRNGC